MAQTETDASVLNVKLLVEEPETFLLSRMNVNVQEIEMMQLCTRCTGGIHVSKLIHVLRALICYGYSERLFSISPKDEDTKRATCKYLHHKLRDATSANDNATVDLIVSSVMRKIQRKCEDMETWVDEERYKLQSVIDSNAKVSIKHNRASLIRTTLSFVLAGTFRLYAKCTYH